jgi:membrane fusion protein (multidrug efflux system)
MNSHTFASQTNCTYDNFNDNPVNLHMTFRHWFFTVTILSIVFIQACTSGNTPPKSKGPDFSNINVEAMIATSQPFSKTVEANGSLVAAEFVEIRPELAGRLVKLNIDEGRTVTENTLLGQIFNEDLLAQKTRIQAQIDIAEKTESRLKALLNVNGVNQQDYDQALTQVTSLKAEQAVLDAQIRKTEIRAPFSGKLGFRNVSPGAYVSPADILTTLQKTEGTKVDFVLPESATILPVIGESVEVILSSSQTATAKIIAVDAQVDPSTRNLKFRALIQGSNTYYLMPGRFVTVKIAQQSRQVVLIPAGAIIPESRSKKAVLIKGGLAQFTDVETGFRGRGLIEITKGIAAGDTLATEGLLFLKPGSPVSIKKFVQPVNETFTP